MNRLEEIFENKRIDLGINKLDFVYNELGITYPTYQTLIGKHKDLSNIQINTLNKVSNYLGISNTELLKLAKEEI